MDAAGQPLRNGYKRFQGDLQLVLAERFDIDNLIDQLQPCVALAVIEHHAEVLRGGMGVKRFAVGKCHIIAR